MVFGPHSVLKLTVDACGTIPDIKLSDVGRDITKEIAEATEKRNKAKKERDDAWKDYAEKAISEIPQPSPGELESFENTCFEKTKLYKEAEDELKALSECTQNRETIRPNPFVTVTLDEDVPGSVPIVFTHAYKEDKRPLWHEIFEDIPIGLLAHGKWGRQLLTGTPSPYCPTRLNFWIYHDNGQDQKEDYWKRDEPQRDLLLGRACLNFGTLICNGLENWHELSVLDKFETPIPRCKLRVQTTMCTVSPDAVQVTRPMQFPGGVVCGGSDAAPGCAWSADGPAADVDLQFQRPVQVRRDERRKATCKGKKKTKCKSRTVRYE